MKRPRGGARGLSAWSLLVLLMIGAAPAAAQDVANPAYTAWARFEPGAMARYSGNSKTMGIDTTVETSIRLVSKASDKVVVEVTRKVTTAGETVDESPRKEEIRATVPAGRGMTPVGEETIAAMGRQFQTRVYQRTEAGGEIRALVRTWMSDDVPGGVVKVDSRTEGPVAMSTLIELKEFRVK
jgi:hypothetical protein